MAAISPKRKATGLAAMTTPPWRDAIRNRYLERVRQSRASFLERYRSLNSPSSSSMDWAAFDKENGRNIDRQIDAYWEDESKDPVFPEEGDEASQLAAMVAAYEEEAATTRLPCPVCGVGALSCVNGDIACDSCGLRVEAGSCRDLASVDLRLSSAGSHDCDSPRLGFYPRWTGAHSRQLRVACAACGFDAPAL